MKQCCKTYLTEQFGDEDVVKEIYEEYAKSIQEKLPELEAALVTENWLALDTLAHAVKGNALATGDTDAANEAIAIRIAAKMSEKNDARSHLEKLKELAKEI
jgi:HPt (histidine-containing phosphotransfer) domain-containing protein